MALDWTTEQVAEHLGITPQDVYESRRKGAFPGNVGRRRGKRLVFRADLIENGPQESPTTTDIDEAILWTLQGIEAKLGLILRAINKSNTPEAT